MKLKLGFLTFACSLCLVAGGLTFGAGSASAVALTLQNWSFDATSANGSLVKDIQQIDINGFSLVNGTGTSASGTFSEYGTFETTAFEGTSGSIHNTGLGSTPGFQLTFVLSNVTGTYSAGLDSNGDHNNDLLFTGGDLSVYLSSSLDYGQMSGNNYGASSGKLVGEFSVVAGPNSYGNIDLDNSPQDGNTDITFQTVGNVNGLTNGLLPGIWFDQSGKDLSSIDSPLVLGLTDTNNKVLYPGSTTLPSAYTAASGLTAPASSAVNDARNPAFFVSSGGHFNLAEVPEPTTMLLMGLGLVGLAAPKMRKRKGC
jgi:hypothetical protein